MNEYIKREEAIEATKHAWAKGLETSQYLEIIPAANVAPVQEWIPVKDRLPEPKEKAICLNRDGEMMIGTYTEWGWMFPCYFKSPTHWMPMPQLPKGE